MILNGEKVVRAWHIDTVREYYCGGAFLPDDLEYFCELPGNIYAWKRYGKSKTLMPSGALGLWSVSIQEMILNHPPDWPMNNAKTTQETNLCNCEIQTLMIRGCMCGGK